MKIGDNVKLLDGSWSVSLTQESIMRRSPARDSSRRWIIVALGCGNILDGEYSCYEDRPWAINNCIIIDTMFSEIVYTKIKYLQPINPPKETLVELKINGKITFISKESAKALNLI